MKKSILLLILVTFFVTMEAKQPTTRELQAKISANEKQIQSLKDSLVDDSTDIARNAFIDSLQAKITEGRAAIKKPVESKEDMSILLGVLLGLITYTVNNLLYKIKGVKDWVETKFSKSAVTLVLGVLATGIAVVVAYFNGGNDWREIIVWLIGAWGTHFGSFVMKAEKPKKA